MIILTILGWILSIYASGAFAVYILILLGDHLLEDDSSRIEDWDDFEEILVIMGYSWFGFLVLSFTLLGELYDEYKKNNKPPKLF